MDSKLAGAYLSIDLGTLQENYRALRDRAAPAVCAAAVKADAYGLGIEAVGPALFAAGCRHFFVALPAEGIVLRALLPDANIYVLGGILPGAEAAYRAHRLDPVLNSPGDIERWATVARAEGVRLRAVLHLDTGMTRLGLSEKEVRALHDDPILVDALDVTAVMSHLACADQPDHPMNEEQRARLLTLQRLLPPALQRLPLSLANSAGIFLGPDYHFGMARPGIALFGGNPRASGSNPMREVVRLRARILQIRDVDSEIPVGYGATYRTGKPSRIATVSVGYADGYLRTLGNRAEGAIRGIRVPVIGRVSMDLITIDVSEAPADACRPGDFVDLIGGPVPLDEVAERAGTISYEILTSLGRRYHRDYIGWAE